MVQFTSLHINRTAVVLWNKRSFMLHSKRLLSYRSCEGSYKFMRVLASPIQSQMHLFEGYISKLVLKGDDRCKSE